MRSLVASLKNSAVFFFALLSVQSTSHSAEEPPFTDLIGTVEAQPIQGAKLLYWDQAAADGLGISTVPGRIGIKSFEADVLSQLAYEIKESSRVTEKKPFLAIEKDDHGGSGRAGFLKTKSGAWVNLKGIGITGFGKTLGDDRGPPSKVFSSHTDGSATLEEAIKETIYSRVADAELKTESSRVLAIIGTGRTIRYPDGNKVPLALIVRAPVRRLDRTDFSGGALNSRIMENLAKANALRLMKGDFVNDSNIGANGEFVDFGCMSGTCGYTMAESSQQTGSTRVGLLSEFRRPEAWDLGVFHRFLGQSILSQTGIPEDYILAAIDRDPKTAELFRELGESFKTMVKEVNPQKVRLDFEEVPEAKLKGNLRIHEALRDFAADFFSNPKPTESDFANSQLEKAHSYGNFAHSRDKAAYLDFSRRIYAALDRIRQATSIPKPNEFAGKLRILAAQKNKDAMDLVRPVLFKNAGETVKHFVNSGDAGAIQRFIDSTVMHNRLGTAAVSEGAFLVRSDAQTTDLLIRSTQTKEGITRLFSYPDLSGAKPGESFGFRVTTDGWKSFKDIPATIEKNRLGTYLRIRIPHGAMPVTTANVAATPYLVSKNGERKWLAEKLNLEGPPLLLNERLGLSPDIVREPTFMRSRYGTPVSVLSSDIDTHRSMSTAQFQRLLRRLNDPSQLIRSEARLEALAIPHSKLNSLLKDPKYQKLYQRYISKKQSGNRAHPLFTNEDLLLESARAIELWKSEEATRRMPLPKPEIIAFLRLLGLKEEQILSFSQLLSNPQRKPLAQFHQRVLFEAKRLGLPLEPKVFSEYSDLFLFGNLRARDAMAPHRRETTLKLLGQIEKHWGFNPSFKDLVASYLDDTNPEILHHLIAQGSPKLAHVINDSVLVRPYSPSHLELYGRLIAKGGDTGFIALTNLGNAIRRLPRQESIIPFFEKTLRTADHSIRDRIFRSIAHPSGNGVLNQPTAQRLWLRMYLSGDEAMREHILNELASMEFAGKAQLLELLQTGSIDVAVDLDRVLVHQIDPRKKSLIPPERIFSAAGFDWRLNDGAAEFIQSLTEDPRFRVSFFSGNKAERNFELLKNIKLQNGQSAFEAVEGRVFSDTSLTSDSSWKYGKKDLTKVATDIDLSRAILIDDHREFSLKGQERNLLWLPDSSKEFQENALPRYQQLLAQGKTSEAKKLAAEFFSDRNKLAWARGMIESALEKAAQDKISFTEALGRLNRGSSRENPEQLAHFRRGIREFNRINPEYRSTPLFPGLTPKTCAGSMLLQILRPSP